MSGIPVRFPWAGTLLLIAILGTPDSILGQNIAVKVKGGDLLVKGDKQGNQIAIRATDTAGSFVIEALNGELINGIAGFVEFSGVTDDIKVDLKGGDNQLILTARNVAGSGDFFFEVFDDLDIKTRSGNDAVVLDELTVRGKVGIKTGGGDDAVTLNAVDVAGQLSVKTGSGDDAVNSLTDSSVGGKVKLQTASGSDCLLFVLTEFDAATAVKLGSGADLFAAALATFNADLKVDGGRDTDQSFDFDNTFFGAVDERNIEQVFPGTITDVVNLFRAKPTFLTNLSLLQTEGTSAPIL